MSELSRCRFAQDPKLTPCLSGCKPKRSFSAVWEAAFLGVLFSAMTESYRENEWQLFISKERGEHYEVFSRGAQVLRVLNHHLGRKTTVRQGEILSISYRLSSRSMV